MQNATPCRGEQREDLIGVPTGMPEFHRLSPLVQEAQKAAQLLQIQTQLRRQLKKGRAGFRAKRRHRRMTLASGSLASFSFLA
jgi:hypothetical protein